MLPRLRVAGVGHPGDQRVRAGDAVHPVHEVERVDEPGDPYRRGHGQQDARYRRVHRQHEQPRNDGTSRRLERQTARSRQPAQVIDEAEHAEETDRGRERGSCPAAGHGHGRQQPHGDREAAAPRRRDAVRRTPGGGVDGVQAPKQRDRYWFRRDDDRAAAGHRVESTVGCHTWMLSDL